MGIGIDGLDAIQKTLEDAAKAFQSLDGVITKLNFDPHDMVSVQNAIAKMELTINSKIAPYSGNGLIEQTAKEMKAQCRDEILKKAELARLESGEINMVKKNDYQNIFQKINDIVADLQRAQHNTFDNTIKKLSKVLNNDILADLNSNLTKGINLQAWLGECKKTRGGMVGSAILLWSDTEEEELGIKILLIHHFANNSREAINFSYDFYYTVNNFTINLQNLISQMIVPFARDYIQYVKTQTLCEDSAMKHNTTGDTYNINVNGGAQQQFNIGHSKGTQNNQIIENDMNAIQEFIKVVQSSDLDDTKKEDLIIPLEIIIEQANSKKPNHGRIKNAYRQIEQKFLDKAYDVIGKTLFTKAKDSALSLAQIAGISI